MKGRKPIPVALKMVNGNPGKRPIDMTTFAPEARIPRCPSHLKGEARKEWRRITEELHRYGMIAEVDKDLLAMTCTTWARYVEAETMIEKAAQAGGSGLFVKTPNGFPVQSPWLSVSNTAIERFTRLCAEFGLSPAARARVAPQTTQMDLPGLELVSNERASISSLIDRPSR